MDTRSRSHIQYVLNVVQETSKEHGFSARHCGVNELSVLHRYKCLVFLKLLGQPGLSVVAVALVVL